MKHAILGVYLVLMCCISGCHVCTTTCQSLRLVYIKGIQDVIVSPACKNIEKQTLLRLGAKTRPYAADAYTTSYDTHLVYVDRYSQEIVIQYGDGSTDHIQIASIERPVRLAIAPNGGQVAILTRNRTDSRHVSALIVDLANLEVLETILLPELDSITPSIGDALCIAWSPDSTRIAVSSNARIPKTNFCVVVNIATSVRLIYRLASVYFLSDQIVVANGPDDRRATLYSLDRDEPKRIASISNMVRAVSADSKSQAVVGVAVGPIALTPMPEMAIVHLTATHKDCRLEQVYLGNDEFCKVIWLR